MTTARVSHRVVIAAGILSIALGALLLELGLRIYNPLHVPLRANDIVLPVNKRLRIENDSNLEKVDAVVYNTYNGLGFRGPPPPENFEDHLTVLTVGGSTTACVGLTDGKTWPDLVLATLAKDSPNLWLNNAGFDGHSTFGHLVLLDQAIASIKPDYVLYLIGVNDVGRLDLNDWDDGLRKDGRSFTKELIRHSELLSTVQVISRTFRAIDLGVFQRKDVYLKDIPTRHIDEADIVKELDTHRTTYLPAYRDRVVHLIRKTRDAGIEPILITQPALYGDGVDPTTGIALGELAFVDTSNGAQQWRVLESYNDVLRSVGKDLNVPVIELAQAMPKDSKYFTDWIHYSIAGAEKVASIVSDGLRPIVGTAK